MIADDPNVDPREIQKFARLSARWWDPQGELKTLHAINPLRLSYIDQRASLRGKAVLDVGCGGGILAESMAQMKAQVTGIDAAEEPLMVARLHQQGSGTRAEYVRVTPEVFAAQRPSAFDAVTCLELLEHVPDPRSIVGACARLARPGADVFFSTINRTPRAYVAAILAAEQLLGLLPKGTHAFGRFIRPAELAAWSRTHGLDVVHMVGLSYNPVTRQYFLTRNVGVNYLLHVHKPADAI
ncbi:MAG: bifunctional 2-polyprenyl-6-hydroxyphenol methylase/3-demethylubiquinol 3-O-methyltransferase UbiG [Gammaproteobacteria bacterium]